MRLDRYFARIGFDRAARPDLDTLCAVHRAHVEAVSYENLDVQLSRPVSRDPSAAYAKIVERGRGGWCYEMNGLLGWALEAIGFEVRRLAGGVGRDASGESVVGNHLVLLVECEGTRLVDAGFGDGLIEPVPLKDGAFVNGPYACALERPGEGWWRYRNDPLSGGPSFDFHERVDDDAMLEERCQFLQTDPLSPFVLNAVIQRWRGTEHLSMRGRVLTSVKDGARSQTIVRDAPAYVATARETFGLDIPEPDRLWERITARHRELFGEP